jgi:hypothetical protein
MKTGSLLLILLLFSLIPDLTNSASSDEWRECTVSDYGNKVGNAYCCRPASSSTPAWLEINSCLNNVAFVEAFPKQPPGSLKYTQLDVRITGQSGVGLKTLSLNILKDNVLLKDATKVDCSGITCEFTESLTGLSNGERICITGTSVDSADRTFTTSQLCHTVDETGGQGGGGGTNPVISTFTKNPTTGEVDTTVRITTTTSKDVGNTHYIAIYDPDNVQLMRCETGTSCFADVVSNDAVTLIYTAHVKTESGTSVSSKTLDVTWTASTPTTTIQQPVGPIGRVFATSASYNGNLGGLAGADTLCGQLASNTGLDGTWKAWLSTGSVDAKSRIEDKKYYNMGGYLVASSIADLTDGTIYNPIIRNEMKNVIISPFFTWTGTISDGSKYSSGNPGDIERCADWTDGVNGASMTGYANRVGSSWTAGSFLPCSSEVRFYCFGTTTGGDPIKGDLVIDPELKTPVITSFTKNPTTSVVNQNVMLTVTSDSDVGDLYDIIIYDGDTSIKTCDTGTSCSVSVTSNIEATKQFKADIERTGYGVVVSTASISVSWVNNPPAFTISHTPSSIILPKGGAQAVDITITPSTYPGDIDFTVEWLGDTPADVKAFYFPEISESPHSDTVLLLSVGKNTLPGTYTLRTTGMSGVDSSTADLLLEVTTLGAGQFTITTVNDLTIQKRLVNDVSIDALLLITPSTFPGNIELTSNWLFVTPVGVQVSFDPETSSTNHDDPIPFTTLTVGPEALEGGFLLELKGTSGTEEALAYVPVTIEKAVIPPCIICGNEIDISEPTYDFVEKKFVNLIPTTGACTSQNGCPDLTKGMSSDFYITGSIDAIPPLDCSPINGCFADMTLDGIVYTPLSWNVFRNAWKGTIDTLTFIPDEYTDYTIRMTTNDGITEKKTFNVFVNRNKKVVVDPFQSRVPVGEKNKKIFEVTIYDPDSINDLTNKYNFEMNPDNLASNNKFLQHWIEFDCPGCLKSSKTRAELNADADLGIIFSDETISSDGLFRGGVISVDSSRGLYTTDVYLNDKGAQISGTYNYVFTASSSPGVNGSGVLSVYAEGLNEFALWQALVAFGLAVFALKRRL